MAMESLFLIQYGELALKGKNKNQFLRRLKANIRSQLADGEAVLSEQKGRLYLQVDHDRAERTRAILSRVFGIHGFAETSRVEKDMSLIRSACVDLAHRQISRGTRFKIEARRTDKGFPLSSYKIACDVGDELRRELPELTVDLYHPDWTVHIEIRDAAYLYSSVMRGLGGLPTGSAGRGLLLLSGGIDSPVAGYLMAKRGIQIDAVYFHTPPYVAEEAREKVEKLTKILSRFLPRISLWVVPYTDVQVKLKEESEPRGITLLSRAAMLEIACLLARRQKMGCIVTGESLGQVASQTLESIDFTGSRATLPVFRPLIGLDKEEIIGLARQIDTYETSILPFEDCCTLFASDHPLIRPDRGDMTRCYEALNLTQMLGETAQNAVKKDFRAGRLI